MKVLATVVLATVALAVPAPNVNHHHPSGPCSINGDNDGDVHCCEGNGLGGILSGLLCNTLTIGETCDSGQHVYCCENNSVSEINTLDSTYTNDAQGGLINLNLLNCINL